MIGVLAENVDSVAVREYFELFKTPWEPYVSGQSYELVLIATDVVPDYINAKAVVLCSSKRTSRDIAVGVVARETTVGNWLDFGSGAFPVYGNVLIFESADRPILRVKQRNEIAGLEIEGPGPRTIRIGYDLFKEVAFILSAGQPPENARIPTLEFHILLLRSLMVILGVPFVEIPPVAAGYEFAACLTHDVDFTGIREHRFDSTMLGFIYRALIGSLIDVVRGRIGWSKCWRNWGAVGSLPFVCLGLKDDFWLEFDRYADIEKDLGSTFFFIPFQNHPGMSAPRSRAAKYDFGDMKEEAATLIEKGCEIGVHGIDAWQDEQNAQLELNRVREVTGQKQAGIRMHWLYFDSRSPQALERAGLLYDSTFGYNDAVGFRAGTAQVFRFLSSEAFLELPLNLQDTALFYPKRMNLSEPAALQACRQIIHTMSAVGGVLTVNWHTRSLSPERLWDDFYVRLLSEIRTHRVWFSTADKLVTWFRARRELRFEAVEFTEEGVHLKVSGGAPKDSPPFRIRVFHPETSGGSWSSMPKLRFVDIPWGSEISYKYDWTMIGA